MTLPVCPLTDLPRLLCGCREHARWNTEFDFDDLTPEERAYLNGESTGRQLARRLRRVIARPLPEYTSRPWSEPREVKVVDSPNLCRVAGCTRPAGDAFVCGGCLDDLDVALGDTPALLEDLAVMAQKEARFSASFRVQESARPGPGMKARGAVKVTGSEMPLAAPAVAQAGLLTTAITTAVRVLCEHRGVAVPALTTEQASRWLLAVLPSVALNVAGPDIVTEVVRETKRSRRLIDRPDERLYIGVCTRCQTPMRAKPENTTYTCTTAGCGEMYDVAAMREAITAKVLGSMFDLTEMAGLSAAHLGMRLTRRQLEGWVERKRLVRAGWRPDPDRPSQQVALYRAGDVLALVEERKSA